MMETEREQPTSRPRLLEVALELPVVANGCSALANIAAPIVLHL
jgi:hypothetical protein